MVTITSFSTLQPISSAMMAAVSKSMIWLREAMMPFFIRHLTTSAPVFFIRLASSPTEISSGILTFSRGLLGDLQLEPAHLLLPRPGVRLLEKVMPPRRWLLVRNLLLAAALLPLHPSAPLAAQILQPLVILGQVHVAALAGVHDLLLGHPGHRLLRRRLGGVLLLGLLPAALSVLACCWAGAGCLACWPWAWARRPCRRALAFLAAGSFAGSSW